MVRVCTKLKVSSVDMHSIEGLIPPLFYYLIAQSQHPQTTPNNLTMNEEFNAVAYLDCADVFLQEEPRWDDEPAKPADDDIIDPAFL